MTTEPVDVPLSEATKYYGLASRVAKRCGVSRQFVSLVVRGSCPSPEVEGCLREEIVAWRAKEEARRLREASESRRAAASSNSGPPSCEAELADAASCNPAFSSLLRDLREDRLRRPTKEEADVPGCPNVYIGVSGKWDLSALSQKVPARKLQHLGLVTAALWLLLRILCGLRDLSSSAFERAIYFVGVRHARSVDTARQAARGTESEGFSA